MRTRARSGAPNEVRFGFSQAVGDGVRVRVAGQVGKDNETGDMVADDVAGQVARAVANLRASARAATDGAQLSAVTAFSAVPLPDLERALRRTLAEDAAVTAVRVPSLSHDTYLVELSATAHVALMPPVRLPAHPSTRPAWAPGAVVAGDDVHVSACHGTSPDRGAALTEALTAVAEVLTDAGCTLADVTTEHVFVVRPAGPDEFDRICDAHASAYGDAPPASTLILVDELLGGGTVAVTVEARRQR